jgi:hypothetical protein
MSICCLQGTFSSEFAPYMKMGLSLSIFHCFWDRLFFGASFASLLRLYLYGYDSGGQVKINEFRTFGYTIMNNSIERTLNIY